MRLVSGTSLKGLFVAAAAAPLCFAATAAMAQTATSTAITTNTTTPLATSTTGDLGINPGAGVTVRTGGAAVTIDSDNTLLDSGTISVRDSASGGTAVLVTTDSSPHTHGIVIAGAVAADDTVADVDTDKDGDADGPFVTPGMVRYGIRVTGNNSFNADIGVATTAVISVDGDSNSAAISLEAPIVGNVTVAGALGNRGDNSYGIRATNSVTGNIDVFGTINTQGKNASAIDVEGPITGRVFLQGTITNSGFRSVNRSSSTTTLNALDADDLLIGGPAIRIANSVSKGIMIDAPPPVTDTTDANGDGVVDNVDQDNDGVPDAQERTGIINNFGSAPGLLAGSTSDIVLGDAGTGRDGFGVVIHGVINSQGLYDKISAMGAQIGGIGGAVDTSSGIGITGQINASAQQADATGLRLGAGAKVPLLVVDGGVISGGANTVAGTVVNTTGVLIEAGANLPTIKNAGTIKAGVNGPAGNATAIQDLSGTLSSITNTNGILASVKSADGTVATGEAIALDLRANTTGVTLTQAPREGSSALPSIGGDILFSAGNFNDTVAINSGVTEGLISFGGGADSLSIDGEGIVRGGLEKGAGSLDVAVVNGQLDLTHTGTTNVSTLSAGGDGTITFTANPTQTSPSQRVASLNVAGTATLAEGSKLGVKFTEKLTGAQSFTVLNAGTLVNNGVITDLTGQIPALFAGQVEISGNAITVNARRRTASEMQLTGARASIFDAFYTAFDADPDVAKEFLGKTTDTDFTKLYQQFLPDYSGGPFKTMANTLREGLAAQAESPEGLQPGQPRSWLQEVGLTVKQETVDEVPYQTGGFGLIGGYERPMSGGGYLGFSGSFMSSEIRNNIRVLGSHLSASGLTGGIYWRQPINDLTIDADLTGGVTWFDSVRRIVDSNTAGQQLLVRQAEGSWTGQIFGGRLGAVYNLDLGPVYVQPSAHIDGVYLNEGSYTEHGGGASVNLAVDSRTNYEASGEIGLTVGANFGRTYHWSPELMIGYRSIFASDAGDTNASFASVAGSSFTLAGLSREKSLMIVRAALRGRGAYSHLAFEAGGEIGEDYEAYTATFSIRFAF